MGLMEGLVAKGDTTGEDKAATRKEATSLNLRRLKRLSGGDIPESLKKTLQNITGKHTWYIIIESWCGDGAQILPVLNRIVRSSEGKIELKIVLRDENPELMDNFLTNGSRSIPKMIWVENEENLILETWGPRTEKISQLVTQYKIENPGADHDELVYNLQLWYTKDRGESIFTEMENLFERIGNNLKVIS